MAFKSMKKYNEERMGNFFTLRKDGDYADVIFLYRNYDDVMAATTHYIKSADYSGYVHCVGKGCPACAKNIRLQNKLFIPMYVIEMNDSKVNEIQFWDRNTRFDQVLADAVFSKTPDPVNYIYRITRHGDAGDINTTYNISLKAANSDSYEAILKASGVTLPEYYSVVCKEVSYLEMSSLLSNGSSGSESNSSDELPSYNVIPRTSSSITPPTPEDVNMLAVSEEVDAVDLDEDPVF